MVGRDSSPDQLALRLLPRGGNSRTSALAPIRLTTGFSAQICLQRATKIQFSGMHRVEAHDREPSRDSFHPNQAGEVILASLLAHAVRGR